MHELETAQARLVESAAADERRRVAREVHDVIAHSLTVTMLHVTAARLAIGRGDPPAADEALDEAERAGRTSLADIRRMVGLLRRSDNDGLASAEPGASDVVELVEGYRAAGLDVSLELGGDLDSIDATTGLALYRIVQESLANACKHAPGAPVRARVDVGPTDVEVTVDNPVGEHVETRDGGHGLVGIRERTETMGGECRVGREANRWLVRCKVPLAPLPLSGAVHS
jgi:signal transduction histidine kinase